MKAATTASTGGSTLSAKVGRARRIHWHWLLAFVVLAVVLLAYSSADLLSRLFEFQPSPSLADDLCIRQPQKHDAKIRMHIPGNGFSGFFFTLGRLEAFLNRNRIDGFQQTAARARNENCTEALRQTLNIEYHCYSAGCLSLVAALLEVPINATFDMAIAARERYARGDIGRYDVVESFVDGLLSYGSRCESGAAEIGSRFDASCSRASAFSAINVVSSAWSFRGTNPFLEKVTRSPSDVGELRALLLGTTRIPFLTGNTFGEKDAATGAYHNDGAFAVWYHKATGRSSSGRSLGSSSDYCSDDASLKLSLPPWSISMYANMLNMFFDRELATGFWRDGMEMGIELPKEWDDAS